MPRMHRLLQAAALALLWSLVGGCAAAPDGGDALADTQWHLVSASSGVLQSHAAGSGVTLEFAQGRASGYGGCNSYSGDYTRSDGKLRIGTLTRTKRGCADTPGAIESAWHAALAQPLEVVREQSQLTLTTADGLVLRFEPGPGAGTPP
jgi:heat shock protein HslJ